MIKALIIDDESSAAKVLQLLLELHVPEVTQIRVATRVPEAKSLIQQFNPDLVFLDIMMPEKNGFELLSELTEIRFELIFTTAFNEFAIRAIRFSALDYLLKPIDVKELRMAVDRYIHKQSQLKQSNVLFKNLLHNLETQKESEYRLAVPTVNGAIFLSTSDIVRLEGEGNYTRFCLNNNQKIVSAKTMKDYEEMLPANLFLRIHKSHLVNVRYIENYLNEGQVVLLDKTVLPVSRLRKKEVASVLLLKGK